MIDHIEQREKVIAHAMTWLNTPFHWGARVKGAGVDCAQFISDVYESCGICKVNEWGRFSNDWHMNTGIEHYKLRVLRHASALPVGSTGKPGDIILVRVGRVFGHSGIVVDWPKVIHVHPTKGVRIDIATSHPALCGTAEFFDPWMKRNA